MPCCSHDSLNNMPNILKLRHEIYATSSTAVKYKIDCNADVFCAHSLFKCSILNIVFQSGAICCRVFALHVLNLNELCADKSVLDSCFPCHKHNVHVLFSPPCSCHWRRPNRRSSEGNDRQIITRRLSLNDAFQIFYFYHRFEALVGCACSRTVTRMDGTKRIQRRQMGDLANEERRSWRDGEIYFGVAGNSPIETLLTLLLRRKIDVWYAQLRL